MKVGTAVLSSALFFAPTTPVPDLNTLPEPVPAAARVPRGGGASRGGPTRLDPADPDPGQTSRLDLPYRAFVIVGGVPGAGKSTLLHRLRVTSPRGVFSVRDPEDIRTRWERLLGGRRGYRYWRPLVYLEHYVRLLLALPGRKTIVLHDTATRGWARRVLSILARLSGRPALLLWLNVSLAESLDGQRIRGRKVPERTLRRHWRRWSRLRPVTEDGEPGFESVHTITRDVARRIVLAPTARRR
ncbi:AAA family ATPase [Cryptosporangium arvum]|uniref:AAA family ATPase n=1 Tax=Cryptosporangium arvum TaxID=80871 RepID=UPI0009FC541A|nr:AAA family ATPase [Cryptosporangium arvum]